MYIQQAIDILKTLYWSTGSSDSSYEETQIQWAIEVALECMREKLEREECI